MCLHAKFIMFPACPIASGQAFGPNLVAVKQEWHHATDNNTEVIRTVDASVVAQMKRNGGLR